MSVRNENNSRTLEEFLVVDGAAAVCVILGQHFLQEGLFEQGTVEKKRYLEIGNGYVDSNLGTAIVELSKRHLPIAVAVKLLEQSQLLGMVLVQPRRLR